MSSFPGNFAPHHYHHHRHVNIVNIIKIISFITIMIAGNWARVTSLLVTISIRCTTSWPFCRFPCWGCSWPCYICCYCWLLMCSYCIQLHCFYRHFQLSNSTPNIHTAYIYNVFFHWQFFFNFTFWFKKIEVNYHFEFKKKFERSKFFLSIERYFGICFPLQSRVRLIMN